MTTTVTRAGGSEGDLRPVRRRVGRLLVALAACALGLAGLVFGSLPAPAPDGAPAAAPRGGVVAGSIRVFGAFVREPASPDVAAAYLSISNDGDQADTLLSVRSGAAASVVLHDVSGQTPGPTPGPTSGPTSGPTPGAGGVGGQAHPGGGEMIPTGPLTISGGSTVTLAPTRGHLMMQGLLGRLRPGDQVSLLLTFKRAGQVLVNAPVVAIAAPTSTSGGG